MSATAFEIFVEDARAVKIAEAATLLGLKFSGKRDEHPGPCPHCGGTDTFAFNTRKNKWNCRAGGVGGKDAIGLAAHVLGLDLNRRAEFLEACSAVLGRPAPDDEDRETPQEKAAREARLEAQRRRNAEAAEKREREANAFRERERDVACQIYDAAAPFDWDGPAARYLLARGAGVPRETPIRCHASLPYFHGDDEFGHPRAIWAGPAMVVPFIDAEANIIGCHITWIDLGNGPKFRPLLSDDAGEVLPTKKMRGTKKGGLLPLRGRRAAARWIGGEGIENTLAAARADGFRDDTFYFAAGDLGNLAGPADPTSRFRHPHLTRTDRTGRVSPVMVQGPVPKPDQAPDDAFALPDHVSELLLLADGDSEPVMTAAAMARAKARLKKPGRLIAIAWPKHGRDFADMILAAQAEPALS